MRRRSRLAPAAIAVLCVFTIAAGVTVSGMLPRRLALWQPPGIATSPLASRAPVLGAAAAVPGPARATAAGVAAAIAPVISSPVFGSSLGVLVTDLASGKVLYASDASTGFAPASTTKLATSIAAIAVLGPTARFTTTVVAGPVPGRSCWSAAVTPRWPPGRRPPAITRSRPRCSSWPGVLRRR